MAEKQPIGGQSTAARAQGVAGAGVSSLNGLAGALAITTPDSTLVVGTLGSDVTLDVNLASANTWSAPQTFTGGVNVSLGGDLTGSSLGAATLAKIQGTPVVLVGLASGQVLTYNGTDWTNEAPAAAGVSSLNALTGALTLTSPGSTINIGTSGSNITHDINLSHANSWTALQTFGAGITGSGTTGTLAAGTGILGTVNSWTALQTFGNNISFGGITVLVSAPTSGDVLTYNGTNWIATTAGTSGVSSVNSLTGALSLVSANAGISVGSVSSTITLTLGELDFGTLGGKPIVITGLTTSQVLQYNGTDWVNASVALSGVTSLNGLTGALSVSPGNAGLTVTPSGTTITIGLAELDVGTLGGKSFSLVAFATSQVLQYNGTDWVNGTLDISQLTASAFTASQFAQWNGTEFVGATSPSTSNSSAVFLTVTPNAPTDGGNYSTIQAAVNFVQTTGSSAAGTMILVSALVGTTSTVTVGGTSAPAVPTGGLSIVCLRSGGVNSTQPKISTLAVNATFSEVQNVYIFGFLINSETWTATSANIVNACAAEQCTYISASGNSAIVFAQGTGGIQYVYHFNCSGADRNPNAGGTSNVPFVQITGGSSSTGHLLFVHFQVTSNPGSALTGIFLQVANGAKVSPLVSFPLFDFVTTGNGAYTMYQVAGGTSSTESESVEFGPCGYVENGALPGNVRPIILFNIGAHTGGATMQGSGYYRDISWNCAASASTVTPGTTLFDIANTSWANGVNAYVVASGKLDASGYPLLAWSTGTVGTFLNSGGAGNPTFYCRVQDVAGYNGFVGNSAGAVGTSGTPGTYINNNPYKTRLRFTATGGTEHTTDLSGATESSVSVAVGQVVDLLPAETITTSGAATWTTKEIDS